MLLSIGIPSHNRGHRAVWLVKQLLNMDFSSEEIEIICSNNGSTKNTEGYEELKEVKDDRFHYYEFDSNRGFTANVNQVIKMSKGKFCMLLSDEDMIIEQNLQHYMLILEQYPNLGIVRAKSSRIYAYLPDRYETAGMDAISAFYLNDNYVSGVIYNREIITNSLIDNYAKEYENNIAYCYYPHMFYDAYGLLQGDFFSCDVCLVEEGKAENDLIIAKDGPNHEIAEYATYESRLEQMKGFTKQIYDLQTSLGNKFEMFLMLCKKTSFLIMNQKYMYIEGGYDWTKIVTVISQKMKEYLAILELPISREEAQSVYEYIDILTGGM